VCYEVYVHLSGNRFSVLLLCDPMLPLSVTLGKPSVGALALNAFINWPVISSDTQAFYYVMK
jgi:hypothetical protein